jgi:hypothetical protein
MKTSAVENKDLSFGCADPLTLLKREIFEYPLVLVDSDNFASLGNDDTSRRQVAFLGNRRLCLRVANDYRNC